MTGPGAGYGLDPDEIPKLKKLLEAASDDLGMNDFRQRATLEGFLTVEEVATYGNVEDTVEEKVLKLTEFCNTKYPGVIDAMDTFLARTHVTIIGTAEGVAKAGEKYEATEAQVEQWMKDHEPK